MIVSFYKHKEKIKMNKKAFNLNKYFTSNILTFSLMILCDIGVAISMVMWSLFMKTLADISIQNNIRNIKNLLLFGVLFLIFFFLINITRNFFKRSFLKKVNYQLKTDLFNSILLKNINDFSSAHSAKYISILNNDIGVIETDYFMTIPNILENLITFSIATIALFLYEPLIAILTLILSFMPMLIPILCGEKISAKQSTLFNYLELYNCKIKDIFNGFEVIKSFTADNEVTILHNTYANNVENSRFDFRKIQNLSVVIQHTLTYLLGVIQLTFSIYLVLKGKITFGVLLGTMQISNYVNNPIREASVQLVNLKAVKTIKAKLEEILNSSYIKPCYEQESLINPTPITFNNVSFKYTETNFAIKNLNFTFESGKKYAIVGSSGSGKSTLIKLIMKYYENYTGEINIGSQNLKLIDKLSLNNNFSIIHQRVVMFDSSLKDNITMFKPYSNNDLQKAISAAGLSDLIDSLSNGLETQVNESGNNFSGGEQQRISIARSFLKNTSVMLLDEATSSLDNKTSAAIENLILNQNDLTAIIVTHRLVESNLKKYDCIIALNHGCIQEYGSFNQLMDNKNYFYSLYTINN